MKPTPAAFLAEPAPENAAVALFGKHPLAADHLEDTGLSTTSLVAFKQGMYVDGIGDCLSRQSWLKDLGSTESVPYDHHLFCVGEQSWLAARLLQSSDAAGRSQYPLVIALHSGEFALLHQIGVVAAILDESIAAIRTTCDPQVLRELPEKSAVRLSHLLDNAPNPPGQQARESWRQHMPGIGPDGEGLWRCCHALMPDGASAGRARVPLHASASWPSVTLWASFLARLGTSKPVTIIWKNGQNFADIWLAPPGARVLAGLFTDEASQPLATRIPFNVPPAVRSHAESALGDWMQQPELFPRPPDSSKSSILNKVCQSLVGWFKLASAK